ncbi:MAG TPA: sugar transferase [Gemmatimonadaceae bacterium]|nr:sugar transferase [Gemmatimonadaceae bacterium]
MNQPLLLKLYDADARIWYQRQVVPRVLSDAGYRRAKRALDIVVSVTLLPLIVPVLLLCALAIRLDSPGPVFFSQSRTGRGGHRFRMWKLRTMVRNADELKAQYAHLNELTYPDFKITDDPRITRVGRVLRRTSLDELPQIVNVLKGDMSLVGPRPTSFSASTYRLWHTARLEVQPGITGLWQISGRNELDFDDRLRLDVAYIRHRSFTLDLAILVRTIGTVASGRGAN